ncbi:transmembrane protein 150A [Mastacembelus armatus]|uniref:Si:dkey-228d14.5 n=1 Tax=Mastacembelus armatus TaxID=205130 RepID=A0A7N8X7X6_9TELE|nr:transmembrane protein 150A-like [Mastacembelus armatus]
MVLWIIFPIFIFALSFIGTWTVYGLALANNHVFSLSDWNSSNYCGWNRTNGCLLVPTISSSGSNAPESSLFSATINLGSFLFLLFSVFHHAHIMEKHMCHSMLSKFALTFGVVASMGGFAAANCNPLFLQLVHNLGAAVCFMCICFYTALLTLLTRKCVLTGYEKILYPVRISFTVIQAIATICYTVLFGQEKYFYVHLSAIFEWMLFVNLELFQLSYAVEFCFFSSFMISNLLNKRGEEKPLMMTMS